MSDTLHNVLQHHIDNGRLRDDPPQRDAARALDDLLDTVHSAPQQGLLAKLLRRRPALPELQGVYLYGGVGGGKTMLMDMFHYCLPDHIPARRVHFHRFMIEAHDFLHRRKQHGGEARKDMDARLPALARHIAGQTRVLCLDEFHVEDVADAMILSRLFTALFDAGVFCVMTSNQPPDELYADGLQRDSFLPFIDLIYERMRVVELAAAQDYREAILQDHGTYFTPLNAETRDQIDKLFHELSNQAESALDTVEVRGRTLELTSAEGVARATFTQLCEIPLGAEDYWEIARHYHTLVVENVPMLDDERRNAVKRFITLIDVVHDQGRNLIIAAEVPPDALYHGDEFALEFRRTASRLKGMDVS